jgi:hypothetical protein
MKNKKLLQRIRENAEAVCKQINHLQEGSGQVHKMDIDILAGRLREAYALLFELDPEKITDEIEPPAVVPGPAGTPVQPAAETPGPDIIPGTIETPADEYIEELPPEETGMDEKPEKSITEVMAPKEEKQPEPEPEPEPPAQTPPPEEEEKEDASSQDPEKQDTPVITTADLFSGTTTIADAFQQDEDRSIAANMVHSNGGDLKMSIGINDKFLFINELFEGNPSGYSEAIEKLNAAGEISEVEMILTGLSRQYNWNDNSEAYKRLKKIVKQKYHS